MAGNARAHGVEMAINLSIIRGFVTAEVAQQKESGDEQHDDPNDQEHTEARIAGLKLSPLQVPLRQGRRTLFRLTRLRRTLLSFSLLCHITCSLNIVLLPARQIRSRAPGRFL